MILSFAVNGLLAGVWGLYLYLPSDRLPSPLNEPGMPEMTICVLMFVPFMINLSALVVFASRNRPRVVLGILASYSIVVSLALLAAISWVLVWMDNLVRGH